MFTLNMFGSEKHAEIEQELQTNQARLTSVAARLQQISSKASPPPMKGRIERLGGNSVRSQRDD